MTLSEYVKSIGPKAFAEKHCVTYRSALAYSGGARRPRPELAVRLVAETPLSWDDIYADSGVKSALTRS